MPFGWKAKTTEPKKLPLELAIAFADSYLRREEGKPSPCPVCVSKRIKPPGSVQEGIDVKRGIMYSCHKCGTQFMARAIHSIRAIVVSQLTKKERLRHGV